MMSAMKGACDRPQGIRYFVALFAVSRSVADPVFPGVGCEAQDGRWNTKLFFGKTCEENYMKMKEFGPRRGWAFVGPPWIRPWILHDATNVNVWKVFSLV